MNITHNSKMNSLSERSRQRGALTIFTAVFVLILMTLMLLYATRVGLFEQRTSGNDARQKLAFHAAEAGLDYAVEYLMAANLRIISKKTEAAPDGAGNTPVTYRPGWLSGGNTLWADCPDSPGDDHPCGGDIDAGGTGSLYYDSDGDTSTFESLPLDTTLLANLPAGTDVRVTAILCPRTLADPTCLGSAGIPEPGDTSAAPVKFSVWVLAYGYSDCNDDDADGSIEVSDECRGNAHVAVPFGSIQNFKGSPSVPLVSKNAMDDTGSASVVPNPDGGVKVFQSRYGKMQHQDHVPLKSLMVPTKQTLCKSRVVLRHARCKSGMALMPYHQTQNVLQDLDNVAVQELIGRQLLIRKVMMK